MCQYKINFGLGERMLKRITKKIYNAKVEEYESRVTETDRWSRLKGSRISKFGVSVWLS